MKNQRCRGSQRMQQDRGKASANLGPEIQAKIGKQLRAYYAGLIEPPSERFVELLRKLDDPADEGHSE
jgi:hypothetical protein